MGRTDKTFRPAKFETTTPVIALDIVSGNYFKVGNHLRSLAREGHPEMAWHWFVFPAVTMYVAAFEAFLQERLSVEFRDFSDSDDPRRDQTLSRIGDLKAQSKSSAKSMASGPEQISHEVPRKFPVASRTG